MTKEREVLQAVVDAMDDEAARLFGEAAKALAKAVKIRTLLDMGSDDYVAAAHRELVDCGFIEVWDFTGPSAGDA